MIKLYMKNDLKSSNATSKCKKSHQQHVFNVNEVGVTLDFGVQELCYSRTLFARLTVAESAPGPGRISS
jgi:hypothetical protein